MVCTVLTEKSWHEADAVGEHGRLDDVQLGQDGEEEQGQAGRVQRLEHEGDGEVDHGRPLPRLEHAYPRRPEPRAQLWHDEREQQAPDPRHPLQVWDVYFVLLWPVWKI